MDFLQVGSECNRLTALTLFIAIEHPHSGGAIKWLLEVIQERKILTFGHCPKVLG